MALSLAVLYIDKKGFYFYSSQFISPLFFEFSKANVIDLDIVHEGELEEKIEAFIAQNQITVSSVIVVLAESTYFERDFINLPLEQQEGAKREYLDNIPFEQINTKIFPLANGFKLVVVNNQLCNVIKQAFEKGGFTIEGIAPVLVAGVLPEVTDMQSLQGLLAMLLSKFAVLKQNTFALQEKQQVTTLLKQNEQKPKINLKLIILICVFVILLIILGLVIVFVK